MSAALITALRATGSAALSTQVLYEYVNLASHIEEVPLVSDVALDGGRVKALADIRAGIAAVTTAHACW